MSVENEGTTDWKTGLPDDLRANPALADFKDVGALAKSFVDTQTYVGNSIRVPGADASDEDRSGFIQKLTDKAPELMIRPDFNNEEQSREFFRTLGMPEEPSGYKVPEIEGVDLPEERVQFLQKIAHEAGVTDGQFQKFVSKALEADATSMAAFNATQKEAMVALRNEWGLAYEERISAAKKVATATGAPPELISSIEAEKVGADTYKWLFQVSKQLGAEGVVVGNQGNPPSTHITPDEASNRINEMMNNREHPYWNASHPDHTAAVKKMVELMQYKHPDASTTVDALRASR